MAERHYPWRPCRDYVVEGGVRRYCTRRLYHLGGHEHGEGSARTDAHAPGGTDVPALASSVRDLPYQIFLP